MWPEAVCVMRDFPMPMRILPEYVFSAADSLSKNQMLRYPGSFVLFIPSPKNPPDSRHKFPESFSGSQACLGCSRLRKPALP